MSSHRILPLTVAGCLLPVALRAAVPAYGVPVQGYPGWNERSLQMFTNACRMDPVGFNESYVLVPTILLPATYPAVLPVRWNYDLNRSSRFHANEMAGGCPFRHESCDGTSPFTRIKSYYTNSPKIGENIAGGHSDPLSSFIQWIRDDVGNPGVPAVDGSGQDGHRRNIMDGGFQEMGCGYAHGSGSLHDYWVQDFGGGVSPFTSPIYDGTHQFAPGDQTVFFVNYYDPSGKKPQSASVIVDGASTALELGIGVFSRGTYFAVIPSANHCRKYRFEFTDGNAGAWRYPEAGDFITTLEGDCLEEYSNGAPDGSQLAGDATQDGALDLSDVMNLLGYLFLGDPIRLPCGTGDPTEAGNKALLDVNADGGIDIGDAIHIIFYLFGETGALQLGPSCVTIPDCPGVCLGP